MLVLALCLFLSASEPAAAPYMPAGPEPLRAAGNGSTRAAGPPPGTCVPPFYLRNARAVVARAAAQDDGWSNFAYDDRGFRSLRQYRRRGSVRIIPVARLSLPHLLRYRLGDDLVPALRWDTLRFQAVTYQGRRAAGWLLFRAERDPAAPADFSCGSVANSRLPDALSAYEGCLFWNTTLHAYCVLVQGLLQVMDRGTARLQSLDGWMQEQGGAEAVKQKVARYYSDE